jgi:hypothetical protein
VQFTTAFKAAWLEEEEEDLLDRVLAEAKSMDEWTGKETQFMGYLISIFEVN